MSDNCQDDPYVGKIVKIIESRSFHVEDGTVNYKAWHENCLYCKNSLFLVVGVKEKDCFWETKKECYILKPLGSDSKNENFDKNLCWNKELYVNSAWNEVMKIVD